MFIRGFDLQTTELELEELVEQNALNRGVGEGEIDVAVKEVRLIRNHLGV